MTRDTFRRRVRPEKPLVVREPAPELQPDTALARLVHESRSRGIHVEAWTVRGGHVR